ncbi:MAG: PrsW family intramembrane metalloprotease [Candidatus Peregrinibacteria bacterium]|nr:PrsW family intramembrane metalloprotease [Candidatus Peregrinibacteria bacterium]
MEVSQIFNLKILACAIVSLIPILGWIYFFQNRNREKRSYVILTFIAGMLAVIPIKLYEKYWNTAIFYFEHINIFEYLSTLVDFPTLTRLLAFITVNTIVAFGLFIFTAIMIYVLESLSGDNSSSVFKSKTVKVLESPLIFVSIGVICGILAYIFSLTLSQKIWFFIMVGMLEEYVKHLVLRFSDEEKIGTVDDAISFAIIAALGFAFIENIFYFLNYLETGQSIIVKQLLVFLVLRSTVSVVAHVCFSAILGYFYGVAHFAKEIYQYETARLRHPFIQKIHRVLHLKPSTIFKEEKMMEGALLAMVVHALFNSFLEFGQITLMITLLGITFFIVLNLFHRINIHRQTGNLIQN